MIVGVDLNLVFALGGSLIQLRSLPQIGNFSVRAPVRVGPSVDPPWFTIKFEISTKTGLVTSLGTDLVNLLDQSGDRSGDG